MRRLRGLASSSRSSAASTRTTGSSSSSAGEGGARSTVRAEHLGADGTVRAASTRRSRSRWPRPGPPSRSSRSGLIPSGLSNSTHVVGDARDGVLEAIARCRARGALEWLWDVEIGPPGGAPTALATVAIAVRPFARKSGLRSRQTGSGAFVPHAAWSFSAARETPMQARRAVVDWARVARGGSRGAERYRAGDHRGDDQRRPARLSRSRGTRQRSSSRPSVYDDHVCLYVRDEGSGLAPRVDSPGLGLGLGLIAQVADSADVRAPGDRRHRGRHALQRRARRRLRRVSRRCNWCAPGPPVRPPSSSRSRTRC